MVSSKKKSILDKFAVSSWYRIFYIVVNRKEYEGFDPQDQDTKVEVLAT